MKVFDFNHTPSSKSEETPAKWIHIKATDLPCGRLASVVAGLLKGKDSPQYTPHVLTGTRVIITDVEKMVFTGKKLRQKILYKHTQRLGGLQEIQLGKMMDKDPLFVLHDAIKCMLSRTRQRRNMLSDRLFLYVGSEHKHQAQQPVTYTIHDSKLVGK